MLVATLGLIACNSNSPVTSDSITSADNSLEPVPTSMPSEPSSAEFTLQASSSDTDVDLDADNTSTTEQLTFDVYSSTQLDVTGDLQVTTGPESASSDLQKTNPVYLAYQNTPSAITYNGYSTINYTIGSSSYSASLNTQQINMLNNIQQELDQAASYGGSGGGPTPIINSMSSADTGNDETEKPLEEMTDNEIKKWLKDKGYKVKELGNRRFQVIRKYKEDTPSKKMSITSVFDGNTGKMESGYIASKNGTILSEHLSDQEKQSQKTKIKRKDGRYLLFEITQQEKQN